MVKISRLAIAFTASIITPMASAAPYLLTTGTGDGQVTVGVDGFGAFGSSGNPNALDAIYNPVGSIGSAGTTFQSGVALRLAGGTTFLTSGNFGTGSAAMTNPTIIGTSAQGASTFTVAGLIFTLTQSVTSLFDNGAQNGSRLDQSYTITNSGAAQVVFSLIRYFDGDLLFDGSLTDGGGLIEGNPRTLFETDSATGSANSTTFVGINGTGGVQDGFEIAAFAGLRARIASGIALANTVSGDGADPDAFIDANNGYDVTLALGNRFNLGAGASTTYTTQTIFGTGAPEVFVPPSTPAVPEPATWAMFLLGFGSMGYVMRRRSKADMRIRLA